MSLVVGDETEHSIMNKTFTFVVIISVFHFNTSKDHINDDWFGED